MSASRWDSAEPTRQERVVHEVIGWAFLAALVLVGWTGHVAWVALSAWWTTELPVLLTGWPG
ncbi:MAG: hypothetical protein ACRCZP_17425 [Phycicoccus sp.]